MDRVSFEMRGQENAYLEIVNIAVNNFSHKSVITSVAMVSFIQKSVLKKQKRNEI